MTLFYLILEFIAYTAFFALITVFSLLSIWLLCTEKNEKAGDIIRREMAMAPPEPVHDDVRDMIVQRGDFGNDRPALDSEMDAVKAACMRVSG